MTVTPNIFGFGPVYMNEDAGGGGGAGEAPPVVEAAPDAAALAAAAAVEGGVEEAPPAPLAGDPVGTPVSEGDGEVDDGTIPDTLKPYVQKLREEAAEKRVALKAYEEAFGSHEEGDREVLLNVVAALADPERQYEAGEALKALAEELLGDGTDDPNRPLTRADLERIERQKQEAAQQEAAVKAVISEATELGYAEGTREQRRLLDLAVNETKGDLKAAHEAITAERESIIADFVKQVQEGKAKWPTLAPPPGVTPADITGGPPKTFAEARKASMARAKARAASAI